MSQTLASTSTPRLTPALPCARTPPCNTRRKESFISQTINAFDFAEARSAKDADLLWEAKYGKRGEDGKMTREQYA
jgi:hypothetical protein